MSGPCQGVYVISAWHILIAGSRTFFSFVQNRRKLQVSCSTHNPRGCLPSPGCACAVSTRGLKSKPAPGSEKHPQKSNEIWFAMPKLPSWGSFNACKLNAVHYTVICITWGGLRESLWLRVNFTVAILFFSPLMCSCDWPFDYSESPKAHGLKTKAGL